MTKTSTAPRLQQAGLTADPVTLARWAAQPDIDAQRPHTALDLAQTGKVGFSFYF